ncbi:LysB family phage lysis regulatory protein [Kushneria sinocarnis]|uniref:LysB family phage lysis regulatory protein n=1 Tax=Kushneria sinocarnis TaxID=595502 RepID=A0A420X1K5_9GAMM|nr:Rz-like lysis system protein LysB [Kushneria sinocarnis]RKR07664.1 LysB family phage lysis regulatory protein [Kushneria sinocarnis]
MTRYLAIGAVMLMLALSCWALWERSEAAAARADQVSEQLDREQLESQRRQLIIDALWHNARRIEQQRQQLADRRARLARLASNRLQHIRELQHENASIQQWADQPLPDRIIRLRQRDAVTGADAYRQSLRDPGSLHASGESSDHQR